jgi:hypothetical protein
MENLNGHEAGNGRYGQGDPYGNSPFLDPTTVQKMELAMVIRQRGAAVLPYCGYWVT